MTTHTSKSSKMVYLLPKPPVPTTAVVATPVYKHPTIYALSDVGAGYSAPAKFCIGSRASSICSSGSSATGTPQTGKSLKRLRPDGSGSRQRCKRRLDFARLGQSMGGAVVAAQQQQQHNPVVAARRNERERNRVRNINDTFTVLRDHLPLDYHEAQSKANKEMSKVEILRAAIDYIQSLEELLTGRLGSASGGEELRALIQASTSPDKMHPQLDRKALREFLQKHTSPQSTQSELQQSGERADEYDVKQRLGLSTAMSQPCSPQMPPLQHSHSCSVPGYCNSDLNANEVKHFPGFLELADLTPDSSRQTESPFCQVNQISQSHDFLPSKSEKPQHLPNCSGDVSVFSTINTGDMAFSLPPESNIMSPTTPQLVPNTIGNQPSQQHLQGTNNTYKNAYSYPSQKIDGGFGFESNALSSATQGPVCSNQATLFDGLELADVDFTSLLMGCD